MSRPSPITIRGAGLSGMSLALLLARREIPVYVQDRVPGPRHRVCGEFLRGLDLETIKCFELESILSQVPQHRKIQWWFQNQSLLQFDLPQPVYAVSRLRLESHLYQKSLEAGVQFCSPCSSSETEGMVRATGRMTSPSSPWFGFKIHVRKLSLFADLEMHLSSHGYVGLTALEDGQINISGLFHAPLKFSGTDQTDHLGIHRFQRVLKAAGLTELADRLDPAVENSESIKSAAGITFGFQNHPRNVCAIGDSFAFIPPFTGHGMTMALQGAQIASESLEAYSRGTSSWRKTCQRTKGHLRRKFFRKLHLSTALHHGMTLSTTQPLLAKFARSGYFPVQTLLRVLS